MTENSAMYPAASVAGFYFAYPESFYFYINRIGEDQLEDYAMRVRKKYCRNAKAPCTFIDLTNHFFQVNLDRYFLFFRDVNMPKNATTKIHLSFYQNLYLSSPNGIAVYDSELKCLLINKAGSEILHVSQKGVVGKKMRDLFPGIEKTEPYKKYLETLETGEGFTLFFSRVHDDKEQHLCVKTCNVDGSLVLFVSDVTELDKRGYWRKRKRSQNLILCFLVLLHLFSLKILIQNILR